MLYTIMYAHVDGVHIICCRYVENVSVFKQRCNHNVQITCNHGNLCNNRIVCCQVLLNFFFLIIVCKYLMVCKTFAFVVGILS